MDTDLKILGKGYRMRGELPSEYMKKVAKYVDSKFEELSDSSIAPLDTAVLTALNIADELFQEYDLRLKERAVVEQTIVLLQKGLSLI